MFRKKRKSVLGIKNRKKTGILISLLAIMCLMGVFLMKEEAKASQEKTSTEESSFLFELTVDGKSEKRVKQGDVITVTFRLKRTDSSDDYTMYAMQDEIRYDSTFLELVEDSVMLSNGVVSTDLTLADSSKALYMNYLSVNGGEEWKSDRLVGSFQLKVIADSGSSVISSREYLVSKKDGSGSYASAADDVTILLSEDSGTSTEPGEKPDEEADGKTEFPESTAAEEEVTSPATAQRSLPVLLLLLLALLLLLVVAVWTHAEKNRRK